MPVIVTTQAIVSATASTSIHSRSGGSRLPSGSIAGAVVGSLLGVALLIGVVFYLLRRRPNHKFIRPMKLVPSTSPWKIPFFSHSQKPSFSKQPLIISRPLPESVFKAQFGDSALIRSDSDSLGTRNSNSTVNTLPYSGEVIQVASVKSIIHSAQPSILKIPDSHKSLPPLPRESSSVSDVAFPTSKILPSPFLYRVLESRAQASEMVVISPRPPLDPLGCQPETRDPLATLVDIDALIAGAEPLAAEEMGANQQDGSREEREKGEDGEYDDDDDDDDDDDLQSINSSYSELSADLDHSAYFTKSMSRQKSSRSLRRKALRKCNQRTELPAMPPPNAELPPVPSLQITRLEAPAVDSSLNLQGLHGTLSGFEYIPEGEMDDWHRHPFVCAALTPLPDSPLERPPSSP